MNSIIKEDFDLISNEYASQLNTLKDKCIFITGSNGMITTYLSQYLCYLAEEFNLNLYLQCRNVRKAEKCFEEFLGNKNIHIVDWDFENNQMPEMKFDYIIHATSPASTKFFVEQPVDVISPNVIGTWNLLNYVKNNGVKKFLLLSSNSIYGEGGLDKTSLSEDDYGIVDPLNERASYIESKRLAEQMCIAFYRQHGIPTSIIRICHTYGPSFDLDRDGRIIPMVIKKILKNEDITIYKDLDSVIQYTYIADMISALLLVLLCGDTGIAYNAGGDEIVKMDDVIEWMVEAEERITSKIIEKEIDKNYNFTKGKGINFVKLENDRLASLGWRQMYSNKDGFTRVVRSYLEEKSSKVCGGVLIGTAFIDKQEYFFDKVVLLAQAILLGYNRIDTAFSYGTEKIVGSAIRLLVDAGYPRDRLYIQSKFYPVMPYDGESLIEQFEESLANLSVDYLDAYLIHQPVPRYAELDYKERNISVWKKMEELYKLGKVKRIGVSNFLERHILQIKTNCEITPMINQLEINPQFQQIGLRNFCVDYDMEIQGWGSLSIDDETKVIISEIAQKHKVSNAQICLKWALLNKCYPIFLSSNIKHIKDNSMLDFELDKEELEKIRQCNSSTKHRITWWYPRQQMY